MKKMMGDEEDDEDDGDDEDDARRCGVMRHDERG